MKAHMPYHPLTRWVLGGSALLLACGVLRAQSFQQFGDVDNYYDLYAISGDGSTVVGSIADGSEYGFVGFRWRNGQTQTLPNLLSEGPFGTDARAVSYDGSVIVGSGYGPNDGQVQGFRWTAGPTWADPGVTQAIPYPDVEDGYGQLNGISHDGNAASGYSYIPYYWTSGSGSQPLAGVESYGLAFGISGDGQTIVGGDGDAFRWTASGGKAAITIVGSDGSEALAASYNGSTVVGRFFDDSGTRAFASTPGGTHALTSLGGDYKNDVAHNVTANGLWAVGTSYDEDFGERAVLWNTVTGEVFDLNTYLPTLGIDLTGWQLECALDISDDGLTIIGQGYYTPELGDGYYSTWIAVVPEPSAAPLLGAAALAFAGWRRWRRH